MPTKKTDEAELVKKAVGDEPPEAPATKEVPAPKKAPKKSE